MQISVTDAKAKLTELVRRAEADEEIILTRRVKISRGAYYTSCHWPSGPLQALPVIVAGLPST